MKLFKYILVGLLSINVMGATMDDFDTIMKIKDPQTRYNQLQTIITTNVSEQIKIGGNSILCLASLNNTNDAIILANRLLTLNPDDEYIVLQLAILNGTIYSLTNSTSKLQSSKAYWYLYQNSLNNNDLTSALNYINSANTLYTSDLYAQYCQIRLMIQMKVDPQSIAQKIQDFMLQKRIINYNSTYLQILRLYPLTTDQSQYTSFLQQLLRNIEPIKSNTELITWVQNAINSTTIPVSK
jgi:hypothetical protein